MRALVTGATGFVGSAVMRRLLDRDATVRVMARAGSDRRNLEGREVEIVTGELNDPAALDKAVEGCDAVFHVAADYRLWVPDPAAMYRGNVDGTKAVMAAAARAGVRRIVYTSSVATLGLRADGSASDETTPSVLGDMIGHYKRSKFMAEEEVRRLAREDGLPVVIVNPSTPIGPGDIKPTPTGRMIVNAAAGRMPAYVDTGLNIAHVDDVAEGHLLAMDKGRVGERYILGGEDMTLAEILNAIAELTGGRPPRISLPHGLVMPIAYVAEGWSRLTGRGEPMVTRDGVRLSRKRMYFSSAKARHELGYSARPATEALADAIRWFRENGYLAK